MQEIEFIIMLGVMIGCAYTSYQAGRKDGIGNAIEYFVDEGLIELEDNE